jgi:hypothetical protein
VVRQNIVVGAYNRGNLFTSWQPGNQERGRGYRLKIFFKTPFFSSVELRAKTCFNTWPLAAILYSKDSSFSKSITLKKMQNVLHHCSLSFAFWRITYTLEPL